MLSIAVADRYPLVAEGIRAILGCTDDLRVTAQATSLTEASRVLRECRPDILVIDPRTLSDDPVAAIAALAREQPRGAIFVLTSPRTRALAPRFFAAGARAFAAKDLAPAALIAALREVAQGAHGVVAQASATSTLAALSARERAVFFATIEGKTAADIARELGISPRTVEAHRTNMKRKLHARSVLDLLRIAVREGIAPEAA